jgi:hypothetical protein
MRERFRNLREQNLQRSKAAGVPAGDEPSRPTPGVVGRMLKEAGRTETERRRLLKLKRAALRNGTMIIREVAVRRTPGCFEMGKHR